MERELCNNRVSWFLVFLRVFGIKVLFRLGCNSAAFLHFCIWALAVLVLVLVVFVALTVR